jgi:hypothetical protein
MTRKITITEILDDLRAADEITRLSIFILLTCNHTSVTMVYGYLEKFL